MPPELVSSDSTLPSARRRWGTWTLLGLGALLFAVEFLRPAGANWFVFLTVGPWRPVALILVLGLAGAGSCWKPLRSALPIGQPADGRVSLGAGILAGLFLGLSAYTQHRQFFPYVVDESSYLIQAHQLAHGRLWFPAHPLGLSFDSFQLLTRGRVYASAYFPGTALLYVPGIWLGFPPYLTSLAVAAAVAGLMHWVVSRCIDRTAGHLAVLLVLACPMVRTLSIMTMGQLPLLMYALAAVVGWVRWRDGAGSWGWAVFVGGSLGLAALTRPVDALCFGIPIAVGVVITWFDRSEVRRRMLASLLGFVVGVLPCVAVQAISDRGITGDWFVTPFRLYADLDYPNTAYGFHPFDPLARPASPLAQKQALYNGEFRPQVAAHRPDRAWSVLAHYRLPLLLSLGGAVTPFPLLALFWPVAWMTISRRDPLRAMVLSTLPLFLLFYVPYVFFFPHYTMAGLPALVLGLALAACRLPLLWPGWGATLRVFGWLFVAIMAVAAFPQFDPGWDDLFNASMLRDVNRQLADLRQPSIVLFRYSPTRNLHEEPVYNADVAWPDDALVIRAHDLGPAQNAALFRYYARVAPQRRVFRYDEANRRLTPLGTVSTLSAAIIR